MKLLRTLYSYYIIVVIHITYNNLFGVSPCRRAEEIDADGERGRERKDRKRDESDRQCLYFIRCAVESECVI